MNTDPTTHTPFDVSVVLPCLDEASSVGQCVRNAWLGIARLGLSGEVIVADSGSRDDSRTIAADAGARIERAPYRGYGAALRHGIAAARGTYTIIADSDGTYNLTNLSGFWQRLQAGDDLVIGNRFHGHIAADAMPFLNRYLGNPVLSALGRALTHATVGDFHSGMRAFRTDAITALNLSANGMEYASEMIARAAAEHLRISEIPINLAKSTRVHNQSHLRPVRDGLRHVGILIALHR